MEKKIPKSSNLFFPEPPPYRTADRLPPFGLEILSCDVIFSKKFWAYKTTFTLAMISVNIFSSHRERKIPQSTMSDSTSQPYSWAAKAGKFSPLLNAHPGGWKNPQKLCKPSTASRVCITFSVTSKSPLVFR